MDSVGFGVVNEAKLRGIDLRSLNGERFSSTEHLMTVAEHREQVEEFYQHGDSRLLENLDVVLAARRQLLKPTAVPRVPRKPKKKQPFEPTERQLAIAIEVLERLEKDNAEA